MIEAMLAKGLTPVVPSQGSVGASGDLAPLSHMAAAMIGVGAIEIGGKVLPAADALRTRLALSRSISARRKVSRCSTERNSRPPTRLPACSAPKPSSAPR